MLLFSYIILLSVFISDLAEPHRHYIVVLAVLKACVFLCARHKSSFVDYYTNDRL